MSVTESWIAVEWGKWQNIGPARTGPATTGYYNPANTTERTRWVRMVRYHLHISGTDSDNKQIDDKGVRLLNEVVDLAPGLDAAPTALPPQFSIVSDNYALIIENADNRYYSQPRVQRVVTSRQLSNEPSPGLPSIGLPGALSVVWPVSPLPPSVVAEILRNDKVFVKGGQPITD
jgi:hypothetical protein